MTQKKNNHHKAAMAALFLVIFIDSMGLGLLFPILNEVFLDPRVSILSAASHLRPEIWYGGTIAIFMLCWFSGAAILGDLSDIIGRKKVLSICLIGAFVGYFCSGLGIADHSIIILLLGRMIAGFTAGSQPVAQAAFIDLSTPNNKAKYIALIILAGCLGFAFGPLFAALLINPSIVSWFDFTTPLYAAAFLSIINIILLQLSFTETFIPRSKINFRWNRAIDIFISAFRHPDIRFLSVIFFLMIFSWKGFFSYISLFVLKRYNWNPSTVSLYMGAMGFGFAIGSGFLVGFLAKRFELHKSTLVALAFACLAIVCLLYFNIPWVAWTIAIVASTAM